jgi:hypothetical protein
MGPAAASPDLGAWYAFDHTMHGFDLLQFLGGTAKGAKISLGVWRLQRTVSIDVTIE